MANVKFYSTDSYMMQAIVADCKCGDRPVIMHDDSWQVKCERCNATSEASFDPFIAINWWNITTLMDQQDDDVIALAQKAGASARTYMARCGCTKICTGDG